MPQRLTCNTAAVVSLRVLDSTSGLSVNVRTIRSWWSFVPQIYAPAATQAVQAAHTASRAIYANCCSLSFFHSKWRNLYVQLVHIFRSEHINYLSYLRMCAATEDILQFLKKPNFDQLQQLPLGLDLAQWFKPMVICCVSKALNWAAMKVDESSPNLIDKTQNIFLQSFINI